MFGEDLSTCRNLSHSLRSEQSAANSSRISVDLRLPIFLIKQNITLCLVVRASDGVHIVETERNLTVASGILSKYTEYIYSFEIMVMITFTLRIYPRL
jgi:hypothetical protein